MGILLAFIAGVFGAAFSYSMRKSIDKGGSTLVFTVVQLLVCGVFAVIIGPIRTGNFSVNVPILKGAAVVGLALGALMWVIGKGLNRGPAGLIFAMVNSACVVPALVLTLLFGSDFGYVYTFWHGLGALLVIIGLTWAGLYVSRNGEMKDLTWIPFGILAFVLQAVYFLGLQWRALHLQDGHPASDFLLGISSQEATTEWFLPVLCFVAAFSQLIVLLSSKPLLIPNKAEVICGVWGGVVNSLSLYFLMLSTVFASAVERSIIFPVAAVTVIILCNAWGQALYKETINWVANGVTVMGVLVSQLFPTFF